MNGSIDPHGYWLSAAAAAAEGRPIDIRKRNVVPLPFPHLVVDHMWSAALLSAVIGEFPAARDPRWQRFANRREIKLAGGEDMWGPATLGLLGGMARLAPALSELFGIADLQMETVGGGMHLIPPGGRLASHVDFTRSPSGLYRRVNLLVFLNSGWDDTDGGLLELGHPDDVERLRYIQPEFNRTCAFVTSDSSWHGHPRPVMRSRASVAAYFFSPSPPPGWLSDHSTVWADDRPGGAAA